MIKFAISEIDSSNDEDVSQILGSIYLDALSKELRKEVDILLTEIVEENFIDDVVEYLFENSIENTPANFTIYSPILFKQIKIALEQPIEIDPELGVILIPACLEDFEKGSLYKPVYRIISKAIDDILPLK